MKILLLASTSLVCAATLAQAGEPDGDAHDWTGAYVGIHGTWTHSRPGFDSGTGTGPVTDYSFHDDGFGAGLYAGYDWQAGPLVFGVAADYDYLGIANQERLSQPVAGKGDAYDYDLDWAASARLRGGFLLDDNRALLYGTGGVAFASVTASSIALNGASVTASDSTKGVKAGTVFGGGLEYAFAPDWTFKAEYLRYHFGKVNVGDGSNTTSVSFDPGFDQVRFGIAYRF